MNLEDREIVKQFIVKVKKDEPIGDTSKIEQLIRRTNNFSKYYKEILKEYENNNKTYTYMLTFTIDPKKQNVNCTKLHNKLEEYIINLATKRKPQRSDIVKEGTDEDHKHTHWHLGLEMKKFIDFSNVLKNYRKQNGNVDISRSWSNDYNNVLKYINKSQPSTQIV